MAGGVGAISYRAVRGVGVSAALRGRAAREGWAQVLRAWEVSIGSCMMTPWWLRHGEVPGSDLRVCARQRGAAVACGDVWAVGIMWRKTPLDRLVDSTSNKLDELCLDDCLSRRSPLL